MRKNIFQRIKEKVSDVISTGVERVKSLFIKPKVVEPTSTGFDEVFDSIPSQPSQVNRGVEYIEDEEEDIFYLPGQSPRELQEARQAQLEIESKAMKEKVLAQRQRHQELMAIIQEAEDIVAAKELFGVADLTILSEDQKNQLFIYQYHQVDDKRRDQTTEKLTILVDRYLDEHEIASTSDNLNRGIKALLDFLAPEENQWIFYNQQTGDMVVEELETALDTVIFKE